MALNKNIRYSDPKRNNIWTKKICVECNKSFWIRTKLLESKHSNRKGMYCSQGCYDSVRNKRITQPCGQCGKETSTQYRDWEKSKSGHIFCGKSCAAKYNNAHKTYGIRRSRAEQLVEDRIKEKFPTVKFLTNDKEAIGAELDFYFPDLDLAIELNGPLHYQPIFGKSKLADIQRNDKNKTIECAKHNIDLAVIDTSWCGYLSKANKEKIWNLVLYVLEDKIPVAEFESASSVGETDILDL